MADIQKTIYTLTVLHYADEPPRDIVEAVIAMAAGDRIVGKVIHQVTRALAAPLKNELAGVGDDGTFFDAFTTTKEAEADNEDASADIECICSSCSPGPPQRPTADTTNGCLCADCVGYRARRIIIIDDPQETT